VEVTSRLSFFNYTVHKKLDFSLTSQLFDYKLLMFLNLGVRGLKTSAVHFATPKPMNNWMQSEAETAGL
jgi:hypothetical protein